MIVLAVVMAAFGIYGYQRGTKVSLLMVGMVVGALLLMSIFGEQVAALINGLAKALQFVFSGGLQALGNGGDSAGAVLSHMRSTKPLVSSESPGAGVIMILGTAIVIAFLLGLLNGLRGSPSFAGLVLGLISGYLVTAYLLAALALETAILPLPFKVPGLLTVMSTSARSGGRTWQADRWMQDLANQRCLPVAIAVSIVVFVFVAVRMGNASGKKG
jgi:hypothetical protein